MPDPSKCDFKNGWVKIGEISVDTGQMVIVDPVYTSVVDDNDPVWKISGKHKFGQLSFDNGIPAAVVFNTGVGDGTFPVRAKIVNDEGDLRVASVRVDMLDA